MPPPSSTTRAEVLTTFAVADIVITTGAGPHEKVMTPPLATAATTAAEVQLAAVPLPTTVVGCDVSTAWPAAGIGAWPSGLPNDDGTDDSADDAAADSAELAAALFVGVAEDAEDDDMRDAGPPLPVAGVTDTEAAELAGRLCTEVEAAEPQAATPIDNATAASAWEVRTSGRLVDTSRD